MTELCKIAYKYRSDKCPEILHSYTPFYYKLLKDKRYLIKKVLETGIGHQKTMPHVFTCLTLMPLLKKDVIYIIEDARNSRWVARALNQYDCHIQEFSPRKSRDDKLVIVRNKPKE